MTPPSVGPSPLRLWDLPTRLFHWLLAACVIGAVVTAKAGEIDWHVRLGYAAGTLLVFRLLWGVIGGWWSRFVHFVPTPARLWRHLRGTPLPSDPPVGHNPLGALSVLAMLAVLLVQVATGLVSDDEIAFVGPLNRFVPSALGLEATTWHRAYGQYLVLALVGLHLCAIAAYRLVKKQDLVRPMITGDIERPAGRWPSSNDGWLARVLAAVLLAACAGGMAWVVSLGGAAG